MHRPQVRFFLNDQAKAGNSLWLNDHTLASFPFAQLPATRAFFATLVVQERH